MSCISTDVVAGDGTGLFQLCPKGLCACYTPGSPGSKFGCIDPHGPCDSNEVHGCGNGQGDPRLTGFDGRTFDFAGTPGDVFNVITEAKHQLNVAMVDAELHHKGAAPRHLAGADDSSLNDSALECAGTFMTAAGLIYDNHLIEARVGPEGGLTVSADGARVQGSEHLQWDAASLTLNNNATILSLETPMFVWNITAVPPSVVRGEAWKSHIDLGVGVPACSTALGTCLSAAARS